MKWSGFPPIYNSILSNEIADRPGLSAPPIKWQGRFLTKNLNFCHITSHGWERYRSNTFVEARLLCLEGKAGGCERECTMFCTSFIDIKLHHYASLQNKWLYWRLTRLRRWHAVRITPWRSARLARCSPGAAIAMDSWALVLRKNTGSGQGYYL